MMFALFVVSALAVQPLSIDLDKYAGHWYQMWTEGQYILGCTTVDVNRQNDGFAFHVEWEVFGSPYHTDGVAIHQSDDGLWEGPPGGFYVNQSSSGKVSMSPSTNYIVFGVGPEVDGRYDWALVSDPDQTFVQVLARDWDRFVNDQETVVATLARAGFTTGNYPKLTSQDDCKYATTGTVLV